MDLRVRIGGKTLANPVGVASGIIGFGEEYSQLTDLSRLGLLYSKAVTPEPRMGNDVPRMVETVSGMLNSIGLANPGLDRFIAEKVPSFVGLGCPVAVNVAGSSPDDYRQVVETLDGMPGIWGFEINLSCPNVKEGCLSMGTEPSQVERLTAGLRDLTSLPLIVKLTPNVTDIATVAKAAEAGGADAVSCINTLVGMKVDVRAKRPVLPRITGGLSGPAILPVGLAAVWKTAKAVTLPVIGIGGISSTEDALSYLLAGASAIQVGTSLFVDPELPNTILDGIESYMSDEGMENIADFHGYF